MRGGYMSEPDEKPAGRSGSASELVPEAAIGKGGKPMPQHLSTDDPGLDAVDAASADSFPASDPVSSPSIVGATVPKDPAPE